MGDDVPPGLPFDFRRRIDLRLDAEGRWFHDGEPFEHPGLIALFNRGIDVLESTGEPILRVGAQWCYIRCDDVPFIVRTLRPAGDHFELALNTEALISVAPDAFRAGPGGRVYVELGPHRRARLSRAAQAALADRLAEGPDDAVLICTASSRTPLRPLT